MLTSLNYKISIIPNLELYKDFMSYILKFDINIETIQTFLLTSIPLTKTLSSNIIIQNSCINPFQQKNNERPSNFNFAFELCPNNQIFLIGEIIQVIRKFKIKLYISLNFEKFKCIGKIESNFLRNKFIFYLGDNKFNYKKNMEIYYHINLFGLFGLRKINVNILDNDQKYINQIPEWSLEYKTFELSFNNRVRLRSFKNFILTDLNGISILQCGKIDNNTYALDFQNPLAPIQAFVIGITSVINKITC